MNVAILFGRKNSKSIKNKNIFKIFSKPFMYPLDAAKKVKGSIKFTYLLIQIIY